MLFSISLKVLCVRKLEQNSLQRLKKHPYCCFVKDIYQRANQLLWACSGPRLIYSKCKPQHSSELLVLTGLLFLRLTELEAVNS